MNNMEERARELGRIIGQSSEYQAVKQANDALQGDQETLQALQRMEALRGEAQQMIERGEQPTQEMERELDGLLETIQRSSVYQRVAASQENFDKLMYRVNQWILEGIRAGAQSRIITLG